MPTSTNGGYGGLEPQGHLQFCGLMGLESRTWGPLVESVYMTLCCVCLHFRHPPFLAGGLQPLAALLLFLLMFLLVISTHTQSPNAKSYVRVICHFISTPRAIPAEGRFLSFLVPTRAKSSQHERAGGLFLFCVLYREH